MDQPHAILVGSLTVGYHLTGPFPSYFAAREHAEAKIGAGYWYIFKLETPECERAVCIT